METISGNFWLYPCIGMEKWWGSLTNTSRASVDLVAYTSKCWDEGDEATETKWNIHWSSKKTEFSRHELLAMWEAAGVERSQWKSAALAVILGFEVQAEDLGPVVTCRVMGTPDSETWVRPELWRKRLPLGLIHLVQELFAIMDTDDHDPKYAQEEYWTNDVYFQDSREEDLFRRLINHSVFQVW